MPFPKCAPFFKINRFQNLPAKNVPCSCERKAYPSNISPFFQNVPASCERSRNVNIYATKPGAKILPSAGGVGGFVGLGVVTFGVVGFLVGFGFPCASTLMTKNGEYVISAV